MVLLPVKQYYPQTDSATGHGDRMCFSSTCAMAIKYLLPGALRGSNADDDYLRTVSNTAIPPPRQVKSKPVSSTECLLPSTQKVRGRH
jgi:hypothetical protein